MSSAPQGFLAIWSDIASDHETDYLHWLTREHIAERLSVPGFLNARVFRALLPEAGRYLILYDLRDETVVGSEPYLARLNTPTPWSQRTMKRLSNFRRGGGRVHSINGAGRGGFIAPAEITLSPPRDDLRTGALPDRICRVSVLDTDISRTGIATAEKHLRSGDRSFERLVLVEGLDETAVSTAVSRLRLAETAIYELVFAA